MDIGTPIDVKSRVESYQNMKLGMIGTQQYQEGFKAPYRGLPFKPPPLAVVIDFFRSGFGYLWGKLYRNILFNNYIVPTSNILEDVMVNVQIFIKLSIRKIKFVDVVLYNYDRRTNGIIISQKYNCNNLYEYPIMKSILWTKEYLSKNNSNRRELSTLNYFTLTTAAFPYLRYNKYVSKEDVCLVSQFYRNCDCRNLLSVRNKAIIILFEISIFWGKRYVSLLNLVSKIKNYWVFRFNRHSQK